MDKKPFKCPVCRGSGQVPANLYRDQDCSTNRMERGYVDCRTCKGNGVIWGPPPHEGQIRVETSPGPSSFKDNTAKID